MIWIVCNLAFLVEKKSFEVRWSRQVTSSTVHPLLITDSWLSAYRSSEQLISLFLPEFWYSSLLAVNYFALCIVIALCRRFSQNSLNLKARNNQHILILRHLYLDVEKRRERYKLFFCVCASVHINVALLFTNIFRSLPTESCPFWPNHHSLAIVK